ncbi:hypothetical protein PR048_022850 [Dryococelus australis]|uniref:Uncharacterized protein n=1 Tax=Dryococelus australis TaxID=614101 RepID=A0ABQ9GSE5_9NEOP|nr:hypothetical protein PR048_022850 [Dryococelus australis]
MSENSSSNMNNTSCRNKRKGQKHRRSFTTPTPPVGDAHLRKVWWSYWEARSWQHRHQVACWRSQAEALQYENQMLHEYIKVLLTGSPENDAQETQFPSDGQAPSPTPSQKAKRNRRRRNRRKRNARSRVDFGETADDSDFCSDVDEELLDFMEQTMRHRLERG